jgi:hypothetical protein
MRSSLEPFLVTLAAGALVYWITQLHAVLQARRTEQAGLATVMRAADER